MNSRYDRIASQPFRALLADLTPYEIPLAVNYDYLFKFLYHVGFKVNHDSFSISANYENYEWEQLKLLFDPIKDDEPPLTNQQEDSNTSTSTDLIKIDFNWENNIQIPLYYNAGSSPLKLRQIALLHPTSALLVASAIERFSPTILYLCSRSRFSLRRPVSITKFKIRDFQYFDSRKDDDLSDNIWIYRKSIETNPRFVGSYFRYSRTNINSFFGSPLFHKLERQYPFLLKLDVSKCFDSIYTHSIDWVASDKVMVKQNLKKVDSEISFDFFGQYFDKLFQKLNYNETTGIPIGPEASRIFAEIILQEIDVRIETDLSDLKIELGVDYNLYRYVDDYFLFFRDESHKEEIVSVIGHRLGEFKLRLNEAKTELKIAPFTSGLDIFKHRIKEYFSDSVKNNFNKADKKYDLYFDYLQGLREFKALLKELDLECSDVSSFTLSEILRFHNVVSRKALDFFKNAQLSEKEKVSFRYKYLNFLKAVLQLSFFIYATNISPATSLKIVKLVVLSSDYLNSTQLSKLDFLLFKSWIREEFCLLIKIDDGCGQIGIPSINLIDCLTYLNEEIDLSCIERTLNSITDNIEVTIMKSTVKPFILLILLRHFLKFKIDETPFDRENRTWNFYDSTIKCLDQCKQIIASANRSPYNKTASTLLKFSIIHCRDLSNNVKKEVTSVSEDKLDLIKKGKNKLILFDWNIDDRYFKQLQRRTAYHVY